MEQITTLYQPVKFKRNKDSQWERGIKQISKDDILIIDYNQNKVQNFYKLEVDWFNKAQK